jgi:hypothetical protein
MASTGIRQWAFTAIGLTRQADEHGSGEIDGDFVLEILGETLCSNKRTGKIA